MSSKSNRLQKFHLRAPAAMRVQLVGDFTHWEEEAIEMERSMSGEWRISVDLAPGTYEYRFIVDGEWHGGAECTLRVRNRVGRNGADRELV
jgi:1,4-alpha-glucan branching enzyme